MKTRKQRGRGGTGSKPATQYRKQGMNNWIHTTNNTIVLPVKGPFRIRNAPREGNYARKHGIQTTVAPTNTNNLRQPLLVKEVKSKKCGCSIQG
jgi:hypothetical protein